MFTTDANPFGNVKMQPRGTTVTTETAQPPVRLLQNNTVFVLPGNVQENSQPLPQKNTVLFENQSGFGNFVNYLVGSMGGPNLSTFNKSIRNSFVDANTWEDAFDPDTGVLRASNRIQGFTNPQRDSQNPFEQSLDLVS